MPLIQFCIIQFFKHNKKWFPRRQKIKLLILLISFTYPNSHIFVRQKRVWLFGNVWLFGVWLFGGSAVFSWMEDSINSNADGVRYCLRWRVVFSKTTFVFRRYLGPFSEFWLRECSNKRHKHFFVNLVEEISNGYKKLSEIILNSRSMDTHFIEKN